MEQKIKQDRCLGANLRRLRQAAGYTQEQVAAQLQTQGVNMSRDFYAHIERGDYNIRVSELAALCRVLECSYNEVFAGL